MGKKGGGEPKPQVTNSEPWKAYQPYLTDFFGQAQQAYRSGGANYAPFQKVADFNPLQQQAFGMVENRAQGSGTENALRGYLNNSLGGAYSADPSVLQGAIGGLQGIAGGGPNPYLDATYNQASQRLGQSFNESVVPGLQATFGGAGRSNSGLQAQAFGQASRELGDQQNRLATNIYGGAYEQDAARRLQANQGLADIYSTGQAEMSRNASLVPGLSALEWGNIQQLGNVGQQVQGQAQNILDDRAARYDFYQNRPYENLSRYQDWLALGAGQGSNSTTTGGGTGGGSKLTSALGGGLAGFATGGWGGAAIGALGGLLG